MQNYANILCNHVAKSGIENRPVSMRAGIVREQPLIRNKIWAFFGLSFLPGVSSELVAGVPVFLDFDEGQL